MKIYICIGQKRVYGLTDKDLVNYICEKGYSPNILYAVEISDQKIKEQLEQKEQHECEIEQQ